MTKFIDTPEGAAFLATADSRETSSEIMEAIAFFAKDMGEAVRLWEGDGFGEICHEIDIWERVTKNGRLDPHDFFWGSCGSGWWDVRLER